MESITGGNTPKYQELTEQLRLQIVSGEIAPGQKLPSENTLSAQYQVSRQTVRKALAILQNEGYIYAEHGRGTFCSEMMRHAHPSKNIAVVTTYLSDYIFPRVIQGIDDVLTGAGYSIVLKNTKNSRTREAVMAGLKYLFYSLCGAYLALFGLYFINRYGNTLTFTPGGVLDPSLVTGHEALLLVVAFLMLLGFGVKAGLFPMQGWLPAAHPVAPAPASAVLSGIIVKSGVLGIIRVIYFIFGAQFLHGTWVQKVFLTLTLVTVFLGSMLAYMEKGLKKRLAYSTVSQVSYILFGLALLNPAGMTGALLHVIFHAMIKSGLFLCAGAIIFRTGKRQVSQLKGIGKEMPVTIGCMTLLSLALIGIPPASGFVSKWYLAEGALASDTGIFSWLGPVVLLLSALLTAGYLLPIPMKGFFPGEEEEKTGFEKKEVDSVMLVPLLILAILAVVLGMFPGGLLSCIAGITGQLFTA